MIHRKTYRLFEEDERELVYEDILDEEGKMISFKDYQSPNQAEGFYEYNSGGQLICEREMSDGVEAVKTEYLYNSSGDIISRKLFIAGELFEELSHEYIDTGFVERTMQHGEEIERFVKSKNGDKSSREFFEGSELVERHNGTYDAKTRIERIEVMDAVETLLAIRHRFFDEAGNVVKYEEKNGNGNLLVLSEYKFQNGEVVFEKHDNYSDDKHYEVYYEYDANRNLISQEITTPSGKLLEYQKRIFDNQNRLISESGYSVGSFNAIYGIYVQGEKYTFDHEYEEN